MRDHQNFQEEVLSNGIRVFTYQGHFPISCMEIQLPVGSGHATKENGFLPGAPHFLEHVQLIRSQAFPEPYSLDRALGLRAGNSNGITHPKATTHWIDTPAKDQKFGIDALVDRVFHPLFSEEDVSIERSVVANERNQYKFYPGKSKPSQYFYTTFIDDVFYPLEQIFGSDEDLASLDVDSLAAMHHRITCSNQVTALAVGSEDFSYFKERLAALPTEATDFKAAIAPTAWGHKEFHTKYYDTVAQPRLDVAWIHPRLPYAEYRAVCFIVSLLINTTQGPLYREFREEKGWTYGIDGACLMREYNTILTLSFPLNTLDQVGYVRECLMDRIAAAIADQRLIDDEITRQLGNLVYSYQTAGSIVSSASTDLLTYGLIHTEQEYRQAVKAMSDPSWRHEVFTRYFAAEDMGSMCFMPERRHS